jgi:hypothetical protein
MTTFDDALKKLLSEEDEAFIADTIDETGYYKTAFQSLKGQGSGLRIGAWIAVAICCSLMFFCIWKFFQVETTQEHIFFASAAVLLNSGQIAFKLWFNMQLNRRAITQEIRRLELVIAKGLATK